MSPDPRDYDNVRALNFAFLDLLKRDECLQAGLQRVGPDIRTRLVQLDSTRIERLAEAPFLVFSLHEGDHRYWDQVLANRSEDDLFRSSLSSAARTLAASATAFAWQLARRDPYVLRLICGASLHWCERIAEQTLHALLDGIQSRSEPLTLRNAEHTMFWQKLLGDGLSTARHRRRAAHLVAMQRMLTSGPARPVQEFWARAARTMQSPGLRVADDRSRG